MLPSSEPIDSESLSSEPLGGEPRGSEPTRTGSELIAREPI